MKIDLKSLTLSTISNYTCQLTRYEQIFSTILYIYKSKLVLHGAPESQNSTAHLTLLCLLLSIKSENPYIYIPGTTTLLQTPFLCILIDYTHKYRGGGQIKIEIIASSAR